MKLIIFSILLFFCFNVTFSQLKSTSPLENAYFIDKDGKKTILYPNINKKKYTKYDDSFDSDYAMNAQFLYYHDNNGNLKDIAQSKIDSLIDGKHIFVNKGIKGNKGPERLHEIIVVSKEYTITRYYGGFRTIYIYDKQGKCVLSKVVVSRKFKDDTKTFENEIKPRFKDCPELLELIKKNLENHYSSSGWGPNNGEALFDGIYNYTCK